MVFCTKRIRLRKKTWKDPRTVLLDNFKFEEEIMVYPGWEGYIQELPGKEPMENGTQTAVFVRHWKPSAYTLGPLEEVILVDNQVSTLKKCISELSGIAPGNVDFAKVRSAFPCDMNVLEVEEESEWNPSVTLVSQYPLHITDDGVVLYYRDRTEELKKLTDEERFDLRKQETARLQRSAVNRITYGYSRKEKPLKIYTDGKPAADSDS